MSIYRVALLSAMIAVLAPAAQAASSGSTEPNPFRKTYVQLGFARNVPEGRTQSTLAPGTMQPFFAYMHNVNAQWMMSLGAGLKTFDRPVAEAPPPSKTLAIWTLSHTTYYVLRLSHPTYLLVGPKLLYLLPTLAGKPPPQRDHIFDSEIGAGLSTELIQGMSDRWCLSLHCERWRGVKTSQLAGFEVSISAMVALD